MFFTSGCIMNVWGYQHWNTANTTLDIYLLFENGHESTQTRCKVCSNLTKCATTIDFCLTSVFLINLEHLSQPTLVLLFILWKGKCWLKVPRESFVKIIQWWSHTRITIHQGSYYDSFFAIEMKNKIPSLSSTMMLI